MTDTKHTPGPWDINYDGGIWTRPTPEYKYSLPICSFRWNTAKEFEEGNNKANARLIAAAPETAAERDRLRDCLAELVEVATLRGDNDLPHPADDDILWTARMAEAWGEADALLEEVDVDISKAVTDSRRLEQ